MQKKHLHLLLLILLLAGCKPFPWAVDNGYLTNNNTIVLNIDGSVGGAVAFQKADIRIPPADTTDFQLRIAPFFRGFADVVWSSDDGKALFAAHRSCSRSLTSLHLENSAAKIEARAIPLPGGNGAAFTLAGPVKRSYRFSITAPAADSIFASPPVRLDNKNIIFRRGNGSLIVASSVRLDSVACTPSDSGYYSWTFTLAPSRKPRILLIVERNETAAKKAAAEYAHRSPGKLDIVALSDLRSKTAFALQTEDDSTNQVFALLAAALVGSTARFTLNTYEQVADFASVSAGLFLASRERPGLVFPESAVPPRTEFSAQEMRDFLRWGAPAYRAVLDYGMAGDDTLHALALRVLAGLSALQWDYVSGNLDVVSDLTNKDEYMRLAIAHVQLANLWELGEKISMARNEHESQNSFRRESLQARRIAQHYFTKSAQQYRGFPPNNLAILKGVLDTTEYEEPSADLTPFLPETFPDTVRFLQAGARYGFNWLDDRPALFWNPRLAVGTFTWQRWIAYRMRSDAALKQTPDFVRLLVYTLSGGLPGMLTDRPLVPAEPSMPAMAAAFQNLAEVYLGVRPDAFRHRVDIEPRLPARWGHTTARVPYGKGFLLIEYDFARDFAIIGMTGIEQQVDVLFGWPLETAGYLRTQFALTPGTHPMRIDLERKTENRLDLLVNEVP
jgi:hypothetical protein